MAGGLTRFGNDLYTGARSIDFIKRRRLWYLVSTLAVLISLLVPLLVLPAIGRGFHFGIEFSRFEVTAFWRNVGDERGQLVRFNSGLNVYRNQPETVGLMFRLNG